MKNISVFLFLIFLFLIVSADNDSSVLRSSVKFYKNLSESEISSWEKVFFGNLFVENEIEEMYDKEEFADIDADDNTKSEKKIETAIKKRFARKHLILKEVEKKIEISEIERSGKSVGSTLSQPEKAYKNKQVAKQVFEKDEFISKEVPDEQENEIDRSDRIRKMKELLKKRKGKSRIEDRRVY